MPSQVDYLVVGAGLFGAVLAERIASQLGRSVLILERRPHIGGNCHSETDSETGIEFHTYGTHIFHTSNETVWNYFSRFTKLNPYRHQVLGAHRDRLFQLPINLETINSFYQRNFRPNEARAFIAQEIARENYPSPRNLEEFAINSIGRPLYEAFIHGYTLKQWGVSPQRLPASIIARLPIRFNFDESYFNRGRWQGIPLGGYTDVFSKLLDHPKIRVELESDYFQLRHKISPRHLTIYTGPIDRYFDYALGRLDWRSIQLQRQVIEESDYQGTSVVNFADAEIPYTRIHEPRHLHPERDYDSRKTVVFREYPGADPEAPFYPIRSESNVHLYRKYRALADREENVLFGGRLGDYAYYDMDQTIAAALTCFERKVQNER